MQSRSVIRRARAARSRRRNYSQRQNPECIRENNCRPQSTSVFSHLQKLNYKSSGPYVCSQ
uniref:Uncharacterized protein n=1 Tax=Rhizophora mucronata TaxID=61149 RepID=A0A2P2PNB5_RHIMU